MNTLEEQILTEIHKYAYYPVNEEEVAKSCTTIAIDFAKSFAEYTNKSDIVFIPKKDKWFNVFDNKTSYTSGQLIELYIQSI